MSGESQTGLQPLDWGKPDYLRKWNDARQVAYPRDLFNKRAEEWINATRFYSAVELKLLHPSYAKLVAMGPQIIPDILRSLRKKPAWWFPLLETLSGANPVDLRDKGNYEDMASAWERWYSQFGNNTNGPLSSRVPRTFSAVSGIQQGWASTAAIAS